MSQPRLDGTETPGTHVTFVAAATDLDATSFELGETVTFVVKGHVVLTGSEDRGNDGIRTVVKVHCDLVELQ